MILRVKYEFKWGWVAVLVLASDAERVVMCAATIKWCEGQVAISHPFTASSSHPRCCIDSGGWVVGAKVLSGSTKIAHHFGICPTDLELCKMIKSTELRIRSPGWTRTEQSSMIWYTIIVLYVFVKIQRGQEPLKWRGCDWFNELQCNDITVRTSSSTAQWTWTLTGTIKIAYVIMVSM